MIITVFDFWKVNAYKIAAIKKQMYK